MIHLTTVITDAYDVRQPFHHRKMEKAIHHFTIVKWKNISPFHHRKMENGKEHFTISPLQNGKEHFTISPSKNGKEHFTISPIYSIQVGTKTPDPPPLTQPT